MKKLLNLAWGFSSIDTSWKNKSPIISTGTFRVVIKFSKTFLQIQSLFIVRNQQQMISDFRGTGLREKKLLNFKRTSKIFTQNTKAISNCISLLTLSSVFSQLVDTNLLAPRETLGLQCICRAQLIIHTIYLHWHLPCYYVTSLLKYCRGQLRINSGIYCIKVLLSIFNFSVKKLSSLESSFAILILVEKRKLL